MKLHLGCGKRYIPGFVHVDMTSYSHVDFVHDVRTLPMFGNGTAELIYACHVLEYFDQVEAVEVLSEWYRVLMPGGVIRLSVPDLEQLMVVYQGTRDESIVIGPLFGRMEVDGGIIYHKTVYDYATLSTVLARAGFRNIQYWNWRTTEHAAVDDFSQAYIPRMMKDTGRLISLNIGAIK